MPRKYLLVELQYSYPSKGSPQGPSAAMAYRKALLCVSLAALAGTGLGLTQTPQADLFSYIPRIPQCGVSLSL